DGVDTTAAPVAGTALAAAIVRGVVSVLAIEVRVLIALVADSTAAVAAARALAVVFMAVVAARVAADMAAGIAESGVVMDGNGSVHDRNPEDRLQAPRQQQGQVRGVAHWH